MAGGVMPTLWVTRGLPASGKTVWARERVESRPAGEVLRLSRDELRRMALPAGYHQPVEAVEHRVTIAQHAAVRALLTAGYDVICDDTNLCEAHLRAVVGIAHSVGAEVRIVDFTGVPVEECIRRDAARPARDHVGEVVIRQLYARYLAPGSPTVSGGGV